MIYHTKSSFFKQHPFLISFFIILTLFFLVVDFDLGFIFFSLIPLIPLSIYWVQNIGQSLQINHEKITYTKTFFSKKTVEIPTHNIQQVQIQQSFAQKIFRFVGNITIDNAGTAHNEIKMKGISDPFALKELIQSHQKKMENHS